MKNRFKNLLPQLAAFAIITIAGLFLFIFFSAKVYFPVSVSIEMKSPEDNVCQLFYSATGGFSEQKSIRKSYRGGDSFDQIFFELPNIPVNYLRFDPGEKPGSFLIKKIEIRVGDQSKVFGEQELSAGFKVVNLLRPDGIAEEYLELKSTNSHDSQMQLIQPMEKYFTITASKKLSASNYIVVALYLISVFLIIVWGKRITNFFLNFKVRQRPLSQPMIIKPTIFSIAVAVLICAKLFLVSAQQMTALTNTGHDCALFIKLAYFLGNGDYLGAYDHFTLIKGFGYPLFIAVTNFVGLPLFMTEQLLSAFAAVLAVKALSPLMKQTGWQLALFAILFFNPATTASFVISILRDSFYYSLSLIVVAGFVGIFLRRRCGLKIILPWAVITGLTLFLHDNTREEGVILLPLLIFISILSVIPRLSVLGSKKRMFGIITVLLPYMILISGNTLLATANYTIYGSYIRNEIKSDAFSDAYAALTSIETDQWFINVPVTKKARMKAYDVSPTFAKLKEHLESENSNWETFGSGEPGEIKGGWFMWALRGAAARAGFHKTLPMSQKLYRQIADEINAAFESGKMKKKSNFTVFAFSWDNRVMIPTAEKIRQIIPFVITFKGYRPYPAKSLGDQKAIAKFQNITNEIANINTIQEINSHYPSRLKYGFLKKNALLYRYLSPVLFIVSVILLFVLSFIIVSSKTRKSYFDYWIVIVILLYPFVVRSLLIAYISVSQWEATSMRYLGQAYPFLLAFEFWAVYSIWTLFFNQNKISQSNT